MQAPLLPRPPRPNEEGAALVIALVFISVFGLLISLILSQTDVNLRTTSVVRGREAKLYAADGGADYAIEYLRQHPEVCSDVGPEETLPPPPGVNQHDIVVSCETKQGSVDPTVRSKYAIITTDPGPNSMATSGGAEKILIQGTVFVGGGFSLKAVLKIEKDDLFQRFDACPGDPPHEPPVTNDDPPQAGLEFTPPFRWICTTKAVPIPPHVLPASPPPAVTVQQPGKPAGVIDINEDCRVFLPGTYTDAPVLLRRNGQSNYFGSGLYYFHDIEHWNVPTGNYDVIAGHPTGSEKSAVTPCANDTQVPGAAGTGAEFVFGGSSSLEVGNNVKMEIFSRCPNPTAQDCLSATTGETPGISLYAVGADAPPGWEPWDVTLPKFLFVDQGGPGFTSHGYIFAPTGPVDITSLSGGTVARAQSGLIARTLHLQVGPPGTGRLQVKAPPGLPVHVPRVTVIKSVSSGSHPISGKMTVRAVVQFANDRAYTPTILSWRRVTEDTP